MRFYTLEEKRPAKNQIALVKLKDIYGDEIGFYVMQYTCRDAWYCYAEEIRFGFVEASGERCMTVDEEDIIGWMPIEDLDEIKVGE